MNKEEKRKLIRYYHRMTIDIALNGMSWSNLWDREKRLPTLRDIINRVVRLEQDYFTQDRLYKLPTSEEETKNDQSS